MELYDPLWISIVGGTALIRSLTTLPLQIQQRSRTLRFNRIKPILESWQHTLNQSKVASASRAQSPTKRLEILRVSDQKVIDLD